MKKFLIFLIFCIFMKISSVYANNLYHGINIDEIYNSSDWNNKEDIKNIVDNYILLKKIKNKFSNCSNIIPDSTVCYDEINEQLIQNFYIDFEKKLNDYNNYKISMLKVYSIPCQHIKIIGVSGEICHIDAQSHVAEKLKEYTKTHIFYIDNILNQYFVFLQNIKP